MWRKGCRMEPSIGMIYDLFLRDRRMYCSVATLRKYQDDLSLFFRFLECTYHVRIRESSFQDLGGASIFQDWILDLRSGKIKNTSIRSYARSVKVFLRWSYDQDYCVDYLKGVRLPKDDAAIQFPLSAAEVKTVDSCFSLVSEQGLRNYCIFHLMLDCGLRRQEVIHLQIRNIDFERNILHILDSKANKSRMVLVPDFLLDQIRNYLQMTDRQSGGVWLFLSLRGGNRITEDTVRNLFTRLKSDAGIPRLHAHLLRHTFATSYLIGGGNLEFLRVFLGHANYAVTQIYSGMAAQLKMLGAEIYRLDPIFFTRGY